MIVRKSGRKLSREPIFSVAFAVALLDSGVASKSDERLRRMNLVKDERRTLR